MAGFDDLEFYPGDPILGLTDLYAADPRPEKVNLGVGIYLDELGRLPLPAAVAAVEQRLAEAPAPRGYLPIGGLPDYVDAARELVFGELSPALAEARVGTVQTLGGSGALKEGADFLHGLVGATTVALSDPSWANHQAIFEGAGFEVVRYRYADDREHRVDVAGMLEDLSVLPAGTVVVLHACCHNPTGYDLAPADWDRVVAACDAGGLVPFLDMAYQGFAHGLETDRLAVEKFAEGGQRFLVANSFSKIFGLYGERVGALSVACADADEARRVRSQLCRVIRTNYSNPPAHGAQLVAGVLGDEELRASWRSELDAMRSRIRTMREELVVALHAAGVTTMDFVVRQNGMFSYSGLDAGQVRRLREEFGVYGTDDGRLCVAGLNEGNVRVVAQAIAAVV